MKYSCPKCKLALSIQKTFNQKIMISCEKCGIEDLLEYTKNPDEVYLEFLTKFDEGKISDKKQMIEPKLTTLSLKDQCALLGLNRSSFYYKKSSRTKKTQIKQRIQRIFEEIPIYGAAKMHQQLLADNVIVSLNTVARYRQEMNLKAVLAVKQVSTTTPIKEHKKHSYKLHGLDIFGLCREGWLTV